VLLAARLVLLALELDPLTSKTKILPPMDNPKHGYVDDIQPLVETTRQVPVCPLAGAG
jgi:hypothetical protein